MFDRKKFEPTGMVEHAGASVVVGYYLPPDPKREPLLVVRVRNDVGLATVLGFGELGGKPLAGNGKVPLNLLIGHERAKPTDKRDKALLEVLTTDGLPMPDDLYRHHEGGMYRVTGIALQKRTCLPLIAYVPEATNADYGQPIPWVCELRDFQGNVYDTLEPPCCPHDPPVRNRFDLICLADDRTNPGSFAIHPAPDDPLWAEKHAVQDDLIKAGWCPKACARLTEPEPSDFVCPVCGFSISKRSIYAGE